jgi:hypothetical protein
MLKRLGDILAFVALGCLFLFYTNEIWRSSRHVPQIAYKYTHKQADNRPGADNELEALWYWTTSDAISFYTSLLALFTSALVGISVLQIRYLIKADRIAQTTASAALKAAEAAETQTAIVANQNDTIKKQHGVGRLEFYATHGPKLLVKQLRLKGDIGPHDVIVEMTVTNIGALQATFGACQGAVYFRASVATQVVQYAIDDYGTVLSVPAILAAGDSVVVSVASHSDLALARERYKGWVAVYVAARFVYSDDNGRRRETAILRQWDGSGRFLPVGDSEYEYDY